MHRAVVGDFALSHAVAQIGDFWSHSWHCGFMRKMMALWVYYNGLLAAAAGIFAGLLSGRFLPNPEIGMLASMIAFLTAMVLWPGCRVVFLDKTCISQVDEQAKRAGILSLGFIMRSSSRMLCLLDATYLDRLWCVFEYACRLHLAGASHAANMVVVPVHFGILTFFISLSCFAYQCLHKLIGSSGLAVNDVVFLSTSLAALTVCSLLFGRILISCARDLAHQKQNLRSFSLNTARCFCCDIGHALPGSGRTLECDRILIEQSVINWFGTVARFDDYVTNTVYKNVPVDALMPYRYLAIGCSPLAHVHMYTLAADFSEESIRAGVYGVFEAFLYGPVAFNIMFWILKWAAQRDFDVSMTQPGPMRKSTIGLAILWIHLGIGMFFAVEQLSLTALGFNWGIITLSLLNIIALACFYCNCPLRGRLRCRSCFH